MIAIHFKINHFFTIANYFNTTAIYFNTITIYFNVNHFKINLKMITFLGGFMNLSYVKKYFINFCVAILISLLIAFVYFITSAFQSINSAIQTQMIKTISTFIISFIIVVILAKMYNENIVENTYKKLSLKSLFKYDKKHISTILSLLMVSIIFAIGTSIFISKLTEGYDSDLNFGMIDFIAAFTYVPFLEELIFRGLFFNIASSLLDMKNHIVKNIAVVANIILFLTMHYSSYGFPIFNIPLSLLISILPRIVISASMVYIYIETRDIKYNIFLHMIYNFTAYVINYILMP